MPIAVIRAKDLEDLCHQRVEVAQHELALQFALHPNQIYIKNGACDYIIKPFESKTVLDAVEKAIA